MAAAHGRAHLSPWEMGQGWGWRPLWGGGSRDTRSHPSSSLKDSAGQREPLILSLLKVRSCFLLLSMISGTRPGPSALPWHPQQKLFRTPPVLLGTTVTGSLAPQGGQHLHFQAVGLGSHGGRGCCRESSLGDEHMWVSEGLGTRPRLAAGTGCAGHSLTLCGGTQGLTEM